MSRKFLGRSISTAPSLGLSRSNYYSSPCTPRRTPRSYKLIVPTTPLEQYHDESDGSEAQDPSFQPLRIPPNSKNRPFHGLQKFSLHDQQFVNNSNGSRFEGSLFPPRTPALITPSTLTMKAFEMRMSVSSALSQLSSLHWERTLVLVSSPCPPPYTLVLDRWACYSWSG